MGTLTVKDSPKKFGSEEGERGRAVAGERIEQEGAVLYFYMIQSRGRSLICKGEARLTVL